MHGRAIVSWVALGFIAIALSWPRATAEDAKPTVFTQQDRSYWAFQPPKRSLPPDIADGTWARNALDRFIRARLDKEGLTPSGEADRTTLVRRLYLDLWGVPPSPEEVDAFVADDRPDAYEQLVDRLLSSPRYGERWARHWLDLVRYAETDGFKSDNFRPDAWRYRDYVIASLNADKPYNQFVTEQLAGDEIAHGDPQALVATGFLRHWPYEDNGRDVYAQRANILNDVTDVTGQVFLGLTFRCARCHDHKYDPILQRDYYRLQAFFVAIMTRDDSILAGGDRGEYERQRAAWEEATAELRQKIDEIEAPVREKMRAEGQKVFPKEIQAILDKPDADRNPNEHIIAELAGKQLTFDATQLSGKMGKDVRERWNGLRKQMDSMEVPRPPALPRAMAVKDYSPDAPEMTIPGDASNQNVPPGYLTILDARDAPIETASGSTGRRTALARWIASDENPLTARVAVNRLWQHHFGRGLVATSGDFGRQGETPTHPELLDYLATELVSSNWQLKPLHRLIVTSATYRQASMVSPSPRAAEVDPDNKLLWRMRTRRLEAEAIRDSILAVSGELSHLSGGPSAYPELPSELRERYGWQPSPEIAQRNRRSVYLFVKRNLCLPILETFDSPDTHDACCVRSVTTTAPQALALLNDRWSLDRARTFAERIVREHPNIDQQIDAAYRLAFSRTPDASQRAAAQQFLSEQASGSNGSAAAALADFCHMLLSANEFVYVD